MPKASMPKCTSCETIEFVFHCPVCDEWTCSECMTILSTTECKHEAVDIPVSRPTWDLGAN